LSFVNLRSLVADYNSPLALAAQKFKTKYISVNYTVPIQKAGKQDIIDCSGVRQPFRMLLDSGGWEQGQGRAICLCDIGMGEGAGMTRKLFTPVTRGGCQIQTGVPSPFHVGLFPWASWGCSELSHRIAAGC
jgi:hypothetical protein